MEKKFIVSGFEHFYVRCEAGDRDNIIAREAGFSTTEEYLKFIKKHNFTHLMCSGITGLYFKDREECQDLVDKLNKRVSNETEFEEGDIVKFAGGGKEHKVLKVMEERDAAGHNILIQKLDDKGYYFTGNSDDFIKVKSKNELEKGDKFRIGRIKYEVICRDDEGDEILYFVKGIKTGCRGVIESKEIDEVL